MQLVSKRNEIFSEERYERAFNSKQLTNEIFELEKIQRKINLNKSWALFKMKNE